MGINKTVLREWNRRSLEYIIATNRLRTKIYIPTFINSPRVRRAVLLRLRNFLTNGSARTNREQQLCPGHGVPRGDATKGNKNNGHNLIAYFLRTFFSSFRKDEKKIFRYWWIRFCENDFSFLTVARNRVKFTAFSRSQNCIVFVWKNTMTSRNFSSLCYNAKCFVMWKSLIRVYS